MLEREKKLQDRNRDKTEGPQKDGPKTGKRGAGVDKRQIKKRRKSERRTDKGQAKERTKEGQGQKKDRKGTEKGQKKRIKDGQRTNKRTDKRTDEGRDGREKGELMANLKKLKTNLWPSQGRQTAKNVASFEDSCELCHNVAPTESEMRPVTAEGSQENATDAGFHLHFLD